MTIAIEPMITAGGVDIVLDDDQCPSTRPTARCRPISSTPWPSPRWGLGS
jgi:hypothetical protein